MLYDLFEIIVFMIVPIHHIFAIIGTFLGGLGALTVRYPDVKSDRLRSFIVYFSPRLETIELAWQTLRDSSGVHDRELIDILEYYFEERYGMTRNQPAQKVEDLANSIRITYPDGRIRSPFSENEPGRIEKRMFYDWMIRRYSTNRGVLMIFAGFVLVMIGSIVDLFSFLVNLGEVINWIDSFFQS